MEKEDFEEKKKKVINEFSNTKKHIKIIAKENNLSLEQVYFILEEYNSSNELQRPGGLTFSPSKKEKVVDSGKEEFNELDETIYNLREQGLSYQKIVDELEKQGTKISYSTVWHKCKDIYYSKGEIEPNQKISQKLDEMIYGLREQGLSYQKIVEKLEEKEIKTTIYTVDYKCKKIYSSKGKIEPKVDQLSEESKNLNETIYNLKEKGLSYGNISDKLKENGISISRQRIEQRHKKILKFKEQQLAEAIINLISTKKATLEQVKIIAEYYGVDLEETMNSLEER